VEERDRLERLDDEHDHADGVVRQLHLGEAAGWERESRRAERARLQLKRQLEFDTQDPRLEGFGRQLAAMRPQSSAITPPPAPTGTEPDTFLLHISQFGQRRGEVNDGDCHGAYVRPERGSTFQVVHVHPAPSLWDNRVISTALNVGRWAVSLPAIIEFQFVASVTALVSSIAIVVYEFHPHHHYPSLHHGCQCSFCLRR
jgi:hypothetical protein